MGWGLLVPLAFLAATSSPADAVAAKVELRAKGSNGYKISIVGVGRQRVTLVASGLAGTARYQVPGRVSRRGIAARFGRLGRVDVSFKPGGRERIETPPRRCKGRPHKTRWGVFAGTIRFRGERGFTRVRLKRAAGKVRTTPRWRCRGRGGRKRSSFPGERASLAATGSSAVVLDLIDRRHRLEVGAFAFGGGALDDSLTLFVAATEERRGRMTVTRTVLEIGRGTDFVVDESLTEATVSPSPPFLGEGRFERGAEGPASWTGSLSVVLPGTARIPLVEPRFRARLYRLGKDGIAKPGK